MDDLANDTIYMYKAIPNGIYVLEDLSSLPTELKIFTLPITGSFNCLINVENIFRYYPLTLGKIETIKSEFGIRTIQRSKKILESCDDKNFMNQITLIMYIKTDETLLESKYVNVKFSNNGSFQISGLKSIFQCNYSINKLFMLFQGKYTIYTYPNKKQTRSILPIHSNVIKKSIYYLECDDIYIIEPSISVINATYKYKSRINQTQFYLKMQELKLNKKISQDVVIPFQPDIISPVTIWLPYKSDGEVSNTIITIFIFESGSISFMACKKGKHLEYAYNFICNILENYIDYIAKKDLMQIINDDDEIKKYINLDALINVVDLY